MISEGSRDTEYCVKIQLIIPEMNDILKYIQTENRYFVIFVIGAVKRLIASKI